MNIQTVIDNLDRTIKGKEAFRDSLAHGPTSVLAEFVQSNINELARIRADLIKVRDGS